MRRHFDHILDLKLAERLAGRETGLQLRFQPIFRLSDGTIARWEALVRCNDGLDEFSAASILLTATHLQLEEELLAWALSEITKVLGLTPPTARIAMNVSAQSLNEPRALLHRVEQAILISGLEPRRLEIEITETAALTRTTVTQHAIRDLRSLGLTVALDDFGVGYADIATLRSFTVDRVKVDRSFMRSEVDRLRDPIILRWIATLQELLDLPLTVEGIENADQLAVARQLGFREAQGFYLARPASVREFIAQATGAASVCSI